jgi:hypothetical protein
MPTRTIRLCALQLVYCFLFGWMHASALAKAAQREPEQPKPAQQKQKEDRRSAAVPGAEYSGMYSFLRDGEFVQFTVEDQGHGIGFVSRYPDPEGTGGFLDHFFKSATLDGNRLVFTTEVVQGVSFEFRGTVERGEGKSRADEAYYVLRGTMIENTMDAAKKTSSRSREVVLKSFPQDLASPQPDKK